MPTPSRATGHSLWCWSVGISSFGCIRRSQKPQSDFDRTSVVVAIAPRQRDTYATTPLTCKTAHTGESMPLDATTRITLQEAALLAGCGLSILERAASQRELLCFMLVAFKEAP